MSHELENRNGVWSFAYSMLDGPGWHNLGQMVPENASTAEWRKAAGHDFIVEKRPVLYTAQDVPGGRVVPMADRFVQVRQDNDYPLGIVSNVFKNVQASEIDDLCDEIASCDERLKRSAAFTLRNGEQVCSTYAYRDEFSVAGDTHKAFLMASTCFDGSGATNVWLSIIRAVCKNTIEFGWQGSKAKISIRHNQKFNASSVRNELAALAQGIKEYQAIGDALAQIRLSREEVSAFFKATLGIDIKAKAEEVSTKSMNNFNDLVRAYGQTRKERNGEENVYDAFTALQAVTRYTGHVKTVQTGSHGGNETVARFEADNFGSGRVMKAKAFSLLMPLIQDKVAA